MFLKKTIGFQGLFLILCLLTIMVGNATAAEYWLRVDAANMTMADGKTVPAWGFALDKDNDLATTDGVVSVPGPTLRVSPGDNVLIIHLKNNLSEAVSLNILGQRLTNNSGPVWTNFPADTETWTGSRPAGNYTARVRSFTHETQPGEVGEYRWESFRPGTYMLQSGTNPAKQVQMGMFLPVVKDTAQGSAYADVPYDSEIVVVFHEVDPVIQNAIAAGLYGAVPGAIIGSSVDYQPRYFLMNGMSYPDERLLHINGKVPFFKGERLLIRFLNAGLETHVPQLQGLYMALWSEDGNRLQYPREVYGFELPPGKTADAIVVSVKNPPWHYPLYDGKLNLTNNGIYPGGMFSYIRSSLPEHRGADIVQ
jgi:FtsP/CotA-like multicopper oxidase with cupredoxin domain